MPTKPAVSADLATQARPVATLAPMAVSTTGPKSPNAARMRALIEINRVQKEKNRVQKERIQQQEKEIQRLRQLLQARSRLPTPGPLTPTSVKALNNPPALNPSAVTLFLITTVASTQATSHALQSTFAPPAPLVPLATTNATVRWTLLFPQELEALADAKKTRLLEEESRRNNELYQLEREAAQQELADSELYCC